MGIRIVHSRALTAEIWCDGLFGSSSMRQLGCGMMASCSIDGWVCVASTHGQIRNVFQSPVTQLMGKRTLLMSDRSDEH